MIWIGPGPHGNAAAAVAHSLHVGFYNKAETLAVETAVKCIVVHPICGADLKDEAEIRGPAAADPVPDLSLIHISFLSVSIMRFFLQGLSKAPPYPGIL